MTAPNARATALSSRLSRIALTIVTWTSAFALFMGVGCSARDDGDGLQGEVKMFVADYEDGSHRVGYSLVTDDGEEFELEFLNPPELIPGGRIRAKGAFVDVRSIETRDDVTIGSSLFSVASFESLDLDDGVRTVAQEVVDGSPKTARMAVVLLNFDGVTPQSLTPNQARSELETVKSYYQEISYGMWNVETDVFGPISIPKPNNCDISNIESLGRQAARNQGIAIDSYNHVGFTLPSNGASGLNCACGLAWVGRAPAMSNPTIAGGSIYTCTGPNVFAHEFGHGFGLTHASTISCGGQPVTRNPYSTCSVSEYGNRFNTMGGGLGHMNAFQKSAMKWLDQCNVVRVTENGTYDLTPIQDESNAIQGLQIPTGDANGGNPLYYYVEFRNPQIAEFNSGPSSSTTESQLGVHVNVAQDFAKTNGDKRPLLLDLGQPMNNTTDPRLTTGRSFSDPDGRVTVTVVDMNQDRARIQVSFPGGGTGDNLCINGQSPDDPVDPPTSAPATLYQHCSQGGYAVNLAAGNYTTAQLSALGIANNDVSSLRLSPGYEAVLYDGDGLMGDSVALTESSGCLVESSFNDRLSSISIAPTTVGATVYQHCSYGGYEVALSPGSYSASQLSALGIVNNDVSSLKVAPGYTATLFDGDNLSGAAVTVSGDDSCLVASSFNDRLSSLTISQNPVASFYQHCSYGGYKIELAPGDYTASDLIALGAGDNDLSSVQVSAGYEVILYDGDNFGGTSVTRSSDTTCLVSQSFNDRVTSMRIRAVN